MHSCFSPLLFVNLSKIGTPFFQEPSLGRERREGGREKWDRHEEICQSLFSLSFSRERSERLDSALSRSNGLSGERVLVLGRLTEDALPAFSGFSAFKRTAELLVYSGSLS